MNSIRLLTLLFGLLLAPSLLAARDLLLVVGTGGEDPYEAEFAEWAASWETVAEQGGFELHRIGPSGKEGASIRALLEEKLEALAKESGELWIVLIGHGTWDGRDARFNLAGDDITAAEFAKPLEGSDRALAVLNLFSASAPFLPALSGDHRVVVTATRSGDEGNFSRFGKYFSHAIGDPESDLDKDGQVSLLEAFLVADRQTAAFYTSEQRIQTEHPLLDDNGDARGLEAGSFEGVVATAQPEKGVADGVVAQQFVAIRSAEEERLTDEQRQRRDALERELATLRKERKSMSDAAYLESLQAIFLEIGAIYREADKNPSGS